MHRQNLLKITLAILLSLATLGRAYAGEVKILAADFHKTGDSRWSVNVTLKHDDTGWEHYADRWRIVDADNNIIGERILFHPHINEQPFTRSLNDVTIQEDITIVYIEAHDKVHGWTPGRLKADMSASKDGRLRVEAKN